VDAAKYFGPQIDELVEDATAHEHQTKLINMLDCQAEQGIGAIFAQSWRESTAGSK